MTTLRSDLKIIYYPQGRVSVPDDPSLPFLLEVELRSPELMSVAYAMLYGGSERLAVRGRTRAVIDEVCAKLELQGHPRLRSARVTGPDGVVDLAAAWAVGQAAATVDRETEK